jgi:hypothetical protein
MPPTSICWWCSSSACSAGRRRQAAGGGVRAAADATTTLRRGIITTRACAAAPARRLQPGSAAASTPPSTSAGRPPSNPPPGKRCLVEMIAMPSFLALQRRIAQMSTPTIRPRSARQVPTEGGPAAVATTLLPNVWTPTVRRPRPLTRAGLGFSRMPAARSAVDAGHHRGALERHAVRRRLARTGRPAPAPSRSPRRCGSYR